METLANEYPLEPLKLQDEPALLETASLRSGAGVGAGAGVAKVLATAKAVISVVKCCIFVNRA